MNDIARVALFRNVSGIQHQAAVHNLQMRLIPTIRKQAGFLLGAWASTEANDTGLSFSVFDNPSSAQATGVAINSAPLLPEQEGKNIPSPTEVLDCEIIAPLDMGKVPTIARLAFLGAADRAQTESQRRWAEDEFSPFLGTLPGLCQAYMLLSSQDLTRLSLTFWDNADTLRQSGAAIGQWSDAQVRQGRMGTFTPGEVFIFTNMIGFVRGDAVITR